MNPARPPSPSFGATRRLGQQPSGARLRRGAPAGRQRGASLIEVLVAFLLLTFGMLGMSAMQINALQNNQSALQRSQASMLAHFKMDAMRANRVDAITGLYNMGALPNSRICGPAVAGTDLATRDREVWINALRDTLGEADTCALVVCLPGGGSAICTVQVQWDDTRGTGGAAMQVVEIVSQI